MRLDRIGRSLIRHSLVRAQYAVTRAGVSAAVASRGVITAATLAGAANTTDATSRATASFTPTNGRLVLATVVSHNAAGPNQPTASGNGQTWDVVSSQLIGTARRITVFRCLATAASAGALTFDFGGQTQTAFTWSVVEFSGVDTSGSNGAGAIVQTTTIENAAATSVNSDLAALENAANAHYCATALSINDTVAADADFALLHTAGVGTGAITIGTQWALNQTRCTPTFGSADTRTISIEIKAS